MVSPSAFPFALQLPATWIWPLPQDTRRWVEEVYDVLAGATQYRLPLERLYDHLMATLGLGPQDVNEARTLRECVRFVLAGNNEIFEITSTTPLFGTLQAARQVASTEFMVHLTGRAVQEGLPSTTELDGIDTTSTSTSHPTSNAAAPTMAHDDTAPITAGTDEAVTSSTNEPDAAAKADIYCICASKSDDGLMIECDNGSCTRQWFHVTCVRLSESDIPETEADERAQAKWFCPSCRAGRTVDGKGFEVRARGKSARLAGAAKDARKRKAGAFGKEDEGKDAAGTGKNTKRKGREGEADGAQEEAGPDQPKYCVCEKGEYGTMIACDDVTCEKWFHLPCVGLRKSPPKSVRWYCPSCRARRDAASRPLGLPPLLEENVTANV